MPMYTQLQSYSSVCIMNEVKSTEILPTFNITSARAVMRVNNTATQYNADPSSDQIIENLFCFNHGHDFLGDDFLRCPEISKTSRSLAIDKEWLTERSKMVRRTTWKRRIAVSTAQVASHLDQLKVEMQLNTSKEGIYTKGRCRWCSQQNLYLLLCLT